MNDSNESSNATVLYNKKDKIGTIKINRPKVNALRIEEFKKMIKFIKESDRDTNIHVVRICSSGDRVFTGGLDLQMLSELGAAPENIPNLLEVGYEMVRTMLQCKKPIVVQVQGPAVAWGTILCLAADFVIAGENPRTFFSLNEIDVGIFPGTGALTLALYSLGLKQAKRILMIPERIYLDKAEEIGIVTKQCSLDSLEQTTLEFCQSLADKPQNILIQIKAVLNSSYLVNLADYFEKEKKAINLSLENDLSRTNKFIETLWSNN